LKESFFLDEETATDQWWSEVGQHLGLRDGALMIADFGCNIDAMLIVTGSAAGTVWIDDTANEYGIVKFGDHPLMQHESRSRKVSYTFAEWYEEWLDEILVRIACAPKNAQGSPTATS
jgi:hypothetical protein